MKPPRMMVTKNSNSVKKIPQTASTMNKPNWATMRPGRVSACIDHVTYMERQIDEQTGETVVKEALKTS